jgi:DNA-binding transcriptional LysR family regulator
LLYYQNCIDILDQLGAANQLAKNETSVVSGRLKLSLPLDYRQIALFPKLESFAKKLPRNVVDVRAFRRVCGSGFWGFDATVWLGSLSELGLYACKIGRMHSVFCASPAYLSTEVSG